VKIAVAGITTAIQWNVNVKLKSELMWLQSRQCFLASLISHAVKNTDEYSELNIIS